MLKQSVGTIILLLSVIALLANSVDAQSAHRFKVDVPFEFVINDQTLPAGSYVVERTDSTRPNILTLKKADSDIVRVVITQRVEKDTPSPASSLIFIRRKEAHYLFQIWTVAAMNGSEIPVSFDKKTKDRRLNDTLITLKARH